MRQATAHEQRRLTLGLLNWRGPRNRGGVVALHGLVPDHFDKNHLAIGVADELRRMDDPAAALETAMGNIFQKRDYYANVESGRVL